jgi:hypothetical protein
MITTRESINYQFSVIFGYSSPIGDPNITVGDVIGPGKLTKKKVKSLSHDVITFLAQYNAMLRDYTGSEVFSIEFELFNFEEEYLKHTNTKIYPKSMILLPGNFKDSDSLLLALKPEIGYLNIHKSNESLNEVSRLFYEVEEFIQRPDLNNKEKERILDKFADRFSKKLYGKLIENKWNKKLIGLSETLPTDIDILKKYATIKSNLKINWNKSPYEIEFFNSVFKKDLSVFKTQAAKEHLKYVISEPSADFVVKNTLKLGRNLFKLVNTGTVDESQDALINLFVSEIKSLMENKKEKISPNEFINENERLLSELNRKTNRFISYCDDFIRTGKKGNISEILEQFELFLSEKANHDNRLLSQKLKDILFSLIEETATEKEKVRANDFESIINYFSEIVTKIFQLIKQKLPKFLIMRKMGKLTEEFINSTKDLFSKEKGPARILSLEIIERLKDFLDQEIEIFTFKFNLEKMKPVEEIINQFHKIFNEDVEAFFDTIKLEIRDIVNFTELMLEGKAKAIKPHIEKFKKFSSEIEFLLSYILRYSTINRFLKNIPDEKLTDPVTFANKFFRFTEKRLGGINLTWKSYILSWIKDYAKIFLKLREERTWTFEEIIVDFINYLEEREAKEIKLENFKSFLDKYIAEINDINEKSALIYFLEQYDYCMEIKDEFPIYLKNQIKQHFKTFNFSFEKYFNSFSKR